MAGISKRCGEVVIIGMEKTGKGIMKGGFSWIRTIRGIRYYIVEYRKELSDINIC